MTTRSTRAPSSRASLANRSWVSGRSGVRPWSCIAIALASQGPIQIGQVALAGGLLEDHDVAAGEHVDANALDDHLDEPVVHAAGLSHGAPGADGQPARRCSRDEPAPTDGAEHEPADVGEERDAAASRRSCRARRSRR